MAALMDNVLRSIKPLSILVNNYGSNFARIIAVSYCFITLKEHGRLLSGLVNNRNTVLLQMAVKRYILSFNTLVEMFKAPAF